MPTHIVDWNRLTDKLDVYSVDEKGNRMEEPDLGRRVDHGTDRGRCRCFADMGIDANFKEHEDEIGELEQKIDGYIESQVRMNVAIDKRIATLEAAKPGDGAEFCGVAILSHQEMTARDNAIRLAERQRAAGIVRKGPYYKETCECSACMGTRQAIAAILDGGGAEVQKH